MECQSDKYNWEHELPTQSLIAAGWMVCNWLSFISTKIRKEIKSESIVESEYELYNQLMNKILGRLWK